MREYLCIYILHVLIFMYLYFACMNMMRLKDNNLIVRCCKYLYPFHFQILFVFSLQVGNPLSPAIK